MILYQRPDNWRELADDMATKDLPRYSVGELCDFLSTSFDDEVVSAFRSNKISGSSFMKLSNSQIEKIIPAMGDAVELQALQDRVNACIQIQVKPISGSFCLCSTLCCFNPIDALIIG